MISNGLMIVEWIVIGNDIPDYAGHGLRIQGKAGRAAERSINWLCGRKMEQYCVNVMLFSYRLLLFPDGFRIQRPLPC